MFDYTILVPLLLGFFIVVIGSGYLLFELAGAIIGASLYIAGTLYGALTYKEDDETSLPL